MQIPEADGKKNKEVDKVETKPDEFSITKSTRLNNPKSGRKLDIHVFSGINFQHDLCSPTKPHY